MRKIFTLMLSLLAIAISAAAQTPDVVLTFEDVSNANESTALTTTTFKSSYPGLFTNGVSAVTTTTKLYASKTNGLKLGASTSAGVLTLVLNDTRVLEKVVVNCQRYSSTKAVSLTVNGVSKDITATSFADVTYDGFESTETGAELKLSSSKYMYVKSISIYFAPEMEQVEAPEISVADNMVTITAVDGAAVLYSIDGSAPSLEYAAPFAITEDCLVQAKATKEGMADSKVVSYEAKYEIPAIVPSMPVVVIGDREVIDGGEYEAFYGELISVEAENANTLTIVSVNDDAPVSVANPYEFAAEKEEIYEITPNNEKAGDGPAITFSVSIAAPEITSVSYNGAKIEEGETVTVKKGSEFAVEVFSANELVVEHADGAVNVVDGKFAAAAEGEYIITASNPANAQAASFIFVVAFPEAPEYAEEVIDAQWTIDGIQTTNTKSKPIASNLKKGAASAEGDWYAATSFNCYSGNLNGVQLGSGDPASFNGGTLTLSNSEIPANALITAVSITGIPGNVDMAWGVSVNGVDAEGSIDFPKAGTTYTTTNHSTKTLDNIELEGNEIVLTMTSAGGVKAFYLSGISVSYMVPAEPEAPVVDVPTKVEHGTKVVWTVKYGKLHYRVEHAGAKSVMARGTDVTEDWTEATENGGKQFTYEYASGANHNVYVKNVVNGKEAYGEAFNINETGGLTGIESVSAEGADGVRELYNLQGVRVSEAETAAGVYIERRGGKVAKVVIR